MGNNNNEQQEVKWGGILNEFLWMCAGVNRKVLRQCPTDYAKYAGVGGTILFTALMAMLSSGYALYTVFNDLYIAMAFGIFWGLMIFNLDRYMVNTMYSDGKHTISKEELMGALPRIILAIFLGIVISTPIEMKIFEDVIKVNLPEITNMANEKFETQKSLDVKERTRLEARIDSLNKEYANPRTGDPMTLKLLDQTRADLAKKRDEQYHEVYGDGATGRPGNGPAARLLETQIEKLEADVRGLEKQYNEECDKNSKQTAAIQLRISDQIRQDSVELARLKKNIAHVDSLKYVTTSGLGNFSARLEAMYMGTAYDVSPTSCVARIMVMLLFIVLEIIPVMFKIMEEDGPYDDKLRALRHEVKILADKKISDINDEVNTSVEISTAQNQDRLAAEVAANKELLAQIAKAQSDILSEAITLWREEELKKVRENPSAYIQSSLEDSLDIEQSK